MNLFDLPWLPPVAEDFRSELKALRNAPWSVESVRRLATASLSLTQLLSLAKLVDATADKAGPGWLKVSLLSNASTDLLVPAITASAPRHGVLLDVQAAPFGTVTQEALDPQSATNRRSNDVLVLALDHRAFELVPAPGDDAAASRAVDEALQGLWSLVAALQANTPAALVIVQTLAPPAQGLFGHLDGQLPGTQRWQIERFNRLLREAKKPGTLLLDVASLAASAGLAQWHDATQWNVGKFAFAHAAVPLFADHLCRLVAAARGQSKKCLVLDLDNTLWGGVIGDDGLSGIVLGQGSPVGEAHLDVQATALALRARGIVLAVSSKNDEAVARRVFRKHPDMLLREEHIAVFQANWQDKASNLRAIAQTLNIGVDALVFLDDNPAERQQVRLALPTVGVPELPDQAPELFSALLLAGGYFEALHFTDEDRQRAAQYQANSARAAALGATSNLDDYLASLAMEAEMSPFDELGRARIAQLINKTNQFNLTTRRYSEADVAAFETDPEVFSLQIRLKDRFGDNGMIGVVICKRQGEDWLIDSWLMSCRVLNRRLERQVLNVLVQAAQARGIRRLLGQFRRTEKNGLVEHHYRQLGLQPLSENETGSDWVQDVESYRPVAVPIATHLSFDA